MENPLTPSLLLLMFWMLFGLLLINLLPKRLQCFNHPIESGWLTKENSCKGDNYQDASMEFQKGLDHSTYELWACKKDSVYRMMSSFDSSCSWHKTSTQSRNSSKGDSMCRLPQMENTLSTLLLLFFLVLFLLLGVYGRLSQRNSNSTRHHLIVWILQHRLATSKLSKSRTPQNRHC